MKRPFLFISGLLALALFSIAPHTVPRTTQAHIEAVFLVNAVFDAVDVLPGDGVCSTGVTQGACTLRAAIQETNALPGADTINVPPGLYTLTIAGNGEDAAATGDLDITDNVTIAGSGLGVTFVDGNGLDTVFDILPGPTVDMFALTIRNGLGVGYPGGIDNDGTLTLTDCVIASNSASAGNAGGAWNSGTMTLIRCLVVSNSAQLNGGGLYNRYGVLRLYESAVRNNVTVQFDGGGIANNLGTVFLDNSTVDENMTTAIPSEGGGITNDSSLTVANSTISHNMTYGDGGGIWNSGTITVTNSTFSGNIASDGLGGGIYTEDDLVALNNVTVAFNNAPGGTGGGIYQTAAGVVTFKNSLIGENTALFDPDCSGMLTSESHNLVQVLAGCIIGGDLTGNLIGLPPVIGALAANGGPTDTHALLAGSPALESGHPDPPGSGGDACEANDQRGILRPQGIRCDMGAFEAAVAAVVEPGGGELVVGDVVTVTFPAEVFTETAVVSYTALAPFDNRSHVGVFFQLTATYSDTGQVATPLLPFTIAVHYDAADLSGCAPEASLALLGWDSQSGSWGSPLNSVVDEKANTVTTAVSQMGLYGVVGPYCLYLPTVTKP